MIFLTRTSTLFIIAGILTITFDTVGFSPGVPMGGLDIKSNVFTDILGIIFILFGIFFLFNERKNKKVKNIEYSKCPKCKDTFTYSELENGMCPKCNIKTIDMEKYYDKG